VSGHRPVCGGGVVAFLVFGLVGSVLYSGVSSRRVGCMLVPEVLRGGRYGRSQRHWGGWVRAYLFMGGGLLYRSDVYWHGWRLRCPRAGRFFVGALITDSFLVLTVATGRFHLTAGPSVFKSVHGPTGYEGISADSSATPPGLGAGP